MDGWVLEAVVVLKAYGTKFAYNDTSCYLDSKSSRKHVISARSYGCLLAVIAIETCSYYIGKPYRMVLICIVSENAVGN